MLNYYGPDEDALTEGMDALAFNVDEILSKDDTHPIITSIHKRKPSFVKRLLEIGFSDADTYRNNTTAKQKSIQELMRINEYTSDKKDTKKK